MSQATAPTVEYREIPLAQLHAGVNVRTADRAIAELAASISEVGIIEPLVVADAAGKGFTVLDGHRRLAAARKVKLTAAPCIVRPAPEHDHDRIRLQLVANLQRDDLTEREEAVAFDQLHLAGMTPNAIATATGRPKAHVQARLGLFVLPEPTRDRVWKGQIPIEDAIRLAEIKDSERRAWLEKFLGTTSFEWKATNNEWQREQERRAEKARKREQARKDREDYKAAVAAAKKAGEPIPQKPAMATEPKSKYQIEREQDEARRQTIAAAATSAAEVRIPWVTARLKELAGQTIVLPDQVQAMARMVTGQAGRGFQVEEYLTALGLKRDASPGPIVVAVLAQKLGLLDDHDGSWAWWDKDKSGPRPVRFLVDHLGYEPTPDELDLASGNYGKPKPARKTATKKTPAKKTVAKKAPVKKAPARQSAKPALKVVGTTEGTGDGDQ